MEHYLFFSFRGSTYQTINDMKNTDDDLTFVVGHFPLICPFMCAHCGSGAESEHICNDLII